MPPPPGEGDGPDVHARWDEIAGGRSPGLRGGPYYGYLDGLLERTIATFARHGFDPAGDTISFVQGMVQDTLPEHGPVAVAHIDCDRYASVRVCLERIGPRLAPGGVMVIDDYDHKSGCRNAVDEYLAARPNEFRVVRKSRLQLVR
jgi:asparagine synthase (glutamine-hydrolysing)